MNGPISPDQDRIDALIESSSLGTPGARKLRKRISDNELNRMYHQALRQQLDNLVKAVDTFETGKIEPTLDPRTLVILGDLAAEQSDHLSAQQFYIEAVDRSSTASLNRETIAALGRLAELAAKVTNYSLAVDYYLRATQLAEHDGELSVSTCTRIGELLTHLGRLDEADTWFRRAAEFTLMNLSRSARLRGDIDGAKQWTARARTTSKR